MCKNRGKFLGFFLGFDNRPKNLSVKIETCYRRTLIVGQRLATVIARFLEILQYNVCVEVFVVKFISQVVTLAQRANERFDVCL